MTFITSTIDHMHPSCLQVNAAAPKSPSSSITDGGLLGTTDAASERMLDWLRNNGAEVRMKQSMQFILFLKKQQHHEQRLQ